MYDLLKISDQPGPDGSLNSGNGVTDKVKVLVKMNRLVGIHVTPTVVVSFFFFLLGVLRWEMGEGRGDE